MEKSWEMCECRWQFVPGRRDPARASWQATVKRCHPHPDSRRLVYIVTIILLNLDYVEYVGFIGVLVGIE